MRYHMQTTIEQLKQKNLWKYFLELEQIAPPEPCGEQLQAELAAFVDSL